MDVVLIDKAVQVIQAVGFPIVVAGYLLIRHDKTLRELTEAITAMREVIAKCTKSDRED